MRPYRLLGLLVALATLGALRPDPAEAQRRHDLTCESRGNALRNCEIEDLVEHSVRLERQLSGAACINGRTWGTQPDLIWVESGCRAEFSYETRGGHDRNGGKAVAAAAITAAIAGIAIAAAKDHDDDDRRDRYRYDRDYRRHEDRPKQWYPAVGVTCYKKLRQCYQVGVGYSAYWTRREFH